MIYLVEDDDSIRELVCYSLLKSGHKACGFARPSLFFEAVKDTLPDLIILDVMLPEEDGFSVLSRIRGSLETQNIPIIMLTARDSEFDKVTALDAGADDYVTKPFGVMELIARVNAHLRRAERNLPKADEEKIYEAFGIKVSTRSHEVTADGAPVSLTFKEFELLCLLISNRGAVLTRDRVLREVWGYEFDGENRTVDVHVRTLRRKLGRCGEAIETVRGVGYKISGSC